MLGQHRKEIAKVARPPLFVPEPSANALPAGANLGGARARMCAAKQGEEP